MPKIPDIIEIVPPASPVQARVSIPGSKSITNRVLILAALREGTTVIEGALWSEDTQVMVECLRKLGCHIDVQLEPGEPSNRTILLSGSGSVGPGGTPQNPLELFVGNAGTAARFLCAMVCLGSGSYRLTGVPRMHARPQAELFAALRQLGYSIDSESDLLPAVVQGTGPKPGAACKVSIRESSQFSSALLLAEGVGGWRVQVSDENRDEAPYVTMTRQLAGAFSRNPPGRDARFEVEPDASSASYFVAADYLLQQTRGFPPGIQLRRKPETDWQVDGRFHRFLPLPEIVSRSRDLADSILTAMIVSPFCNRPVKFVDLGRLRVQECDRVLAMRTELSRCGARIEEHGDSFVVHPSADRLHGAEIETYDDHRIAMCFAVLGLVVPGIRIRNPACVRKTFPNFFQKLAFPAPEGLGVVILGPGRSPLLADHCET